MAIRQLQLLAPIQLTTAIVSYITAPSNTTYRIGRAGFSNPTAGAITISAYLVASGGTANAATQLIDSVSVPAGSTYVSPELAGLVIPAGSSLYLSASANTSITAYASGVSIQ